MDEFRCAILAPTFDNARTLRAVVEGVRAVSGLPVIVVNDGSSDGTADVLAALGDGVDVVTHPHNRGKAAALRTGFDRAAERGFTHVLTIDTDGQHDPADVPGLLAIARQNPNALIVGARSIDTADYPAASRFGRWFSNTMVTLESGVRVEDSQCGLRVYPLVLRSLPARTGRYAFETDILTRCGWANVPVIGVPVRCVYRIAGGRVSHFRKGRDSLAALAMHARLLLRSLIPWSPIQLHPADDSTTTGTIVQRLVRWFSPMRAWRAVRRDDRERRRFAAGLSLGVLIANLPLYGVQTLLSIVLARQLRLNPLAVVAGSHLSTPPVGPLLIVIAVMIGHLLIHGQVASLADFDPARLGYLELLRRVAVEWIVGSVIFGLATALLTFAITQTLLAVFVTQKVSTRPADTQAGSATHPAARA